VHAHTHTHTHTHTAHTRAHICSHPYLLPHTHPDCDSERCLGNRWQFLSDEEAEELQLQLRGADEGAESIEDGPLDKALRGETRASNGTSVDGALALFAPHHKNDRRGFEQISYSYESGTAFAELFKVHVALGHPVLANDPEQSMLFVMPSNSRDFFSGTDTKRGQVAFCSYWDRILTRIAERTHGKFIIDITATAPRSIYIEGITSAVGVPESEWSGFASSMGNTVSTWKKSYAKTLRHRSMQSASKAHTHFRDRVMSQGQGGSDTL
jgi:hypothetical protein